MPVMLLSWMHTIIIPCIYTAVQGIEKRADNPVLRNSRSTRSQSEPFVASQDRPARGPPTGVAPVETPTAVTSSATSGQRADRSRSVRYDDCRATQKPKKGDETNKKLNRLIYLTQQRKSPWLATVRWPFIVRPVAGASLSVRSLFFWASLFVFQ